jgi:hypothetical protein
MRGILIIFVFVASHSFGQELKKKFLGTYAGEIPSYSIDAGGIVASVNKASISVDMEAAKLGMSLGESRSQGSWSVIEQNRSQAVIEAVFPGTAAPQRFVLDKKKKIMVFVGLYPQPNAVLEKLQ